MGHDRHSADPRPCAEAIHLYRKADCPRYSHLPPEHDDVRPGRSGMELSFADLRSFYPANR